MYKLIYYYIYTDFRKQESNDTPAYNALLALCLLQDINLSSIGVTINYFLRVDINKANAAYIGLFIFFSLLLINYFYIFRKKDVIVKKYENNPMAKKRLYFWLYILVSAAFFILVVTTMITHKQ